MGRTDPTIDQADDPTERDRRMVAALIGREPMGAFSVVVRRRDTSPVVLENLPVLDSGRPMPTRYWLADAALNRAIGRLEADQGVKRAEAAIGLDRLDQLHRDHALGRDALLPAGHRGPRPSGGVGGTRRGVKCLHAHYAHFLAGGDDPVGVWVHEQLRSRGQAFDADRPGIATRWALEERSIGGAAQ